MISLQTTKRFNCDRGVRQGCTISLFLFLLAVELLSLNILQNPTLKGISVFGKEFKMSQLADDTTLFLKDQSQIPHKEILWNNSSILIRGSGMTEVLSLFWI